MYLLKSKDESIEKFNLYKNKVEIKLNKKVKMLRSDWGGEYETPIGEFCAQHEIIHEVTTPYSPQSNGVVEHKKSHIERDNECDVNKFWIVIEHVGWSYFVKQLPFN